MEKNNERVLAYSMAKPLSEKEMMEVAGGAANYTTRHTFRVTGGTGPSADVAYDVSIDW
ncbi:MULTISPECIES: hypothetical protein [Legionella]|uniref:hypothetical protein n=1 Tax=Legionella TaxID=445 RepID=UPI000E01A5AA|nr:MULTISPECIES: hypothetical protein [Legionella]MDX1836008.1 hypothetical protein [Legionella taurinensis]QRN02592.1 hypothetical protein GH742_01160 [Legionella sp. MW5194]STY24869.1 Uncharacterised protein [Legionella taurinensis]